MSSITLKLSSLVIRTLSKPIAVSQSAPEKSQISCSRKLTNLQKNNIKLQAKEHERFRRFCINVAQTMHRFDMRMRLGVIHDSAEVQKEAAKEAEAKRQPSVATVKTEAQMKADEIRAKEKEREAEKAEKKAKARPRIRPLSEAKAIDSGATFISETFLFLVAGGLIVFESFRSRRKETSRREDVADRIGELERSEKAAREGMVELEKEILRLRQKALKETLKPHMHILPKEIWQESDDDEDAEDSKPSSSWITSIWSYGQRVFPGKEPAAAEPAAEGNAVPHSTAMGEKDAEGLPARKETESTPVPASGTNRPTS